MRSLARLVALALMPLMLAGCWSYRSLGDLSIVTGLGIDKDPATGDYMISAEVVDLTQSIKQSAPGAKLIEARGRTIFDAVRDAKRKLLNRLYFGNMQIVVIGEQMAREDGVMGAVDWTMRDAETRETINLLIAQDSTARDLLSLEGVDQSILSLEIDAIISDDNEATSSTVHAEIYSIYSHLNTPGIALTLPAFHVGLNEGKKVAEANGVAAFSQDKLVGYLSPQEAKYFLIATNQCHGGILTLAMRGKGPPDTSLEIADSRAETTFTSEGGRLAFHIETKTDVFLAETTNEIDVLKQDQIEALQEEAARRLEMEIEALVKRVQAQIKGDIFGFGHMIHQRDPRLWAEYAPQWGATFEALNVSVNCKVEIRNTAHITSREAIKQ